jgi:regulator of PEP synthase PpsR (kinase-PPPase family)
MVVKKQHENALRTVFFVSDRTGLTAETYGRNLLAQFPDLAFETITLSFIGNRETATEALEQINHAYAYTGLEPIVFSSVAQKEEHDIIDRSNALVIDLFNTFLGPLEDLLGMKSAHTQGISKTILGKDSYITRLDAIDYSLAHDDGVRPDQYEDADVILVGVSRCGKTPTSLYMAMNFSLKAGNYPITPEDLSRNALPDFLMQQRHKLVALTIKPVPLSRIRRKRRPDSDYASLENCQYEVKAAAEMFRHYQLPVFDTTETSIEEIASNVVKQLGIGRERVGFA